MRAPAWTSPEIRLATIAYKIGGAELARAVLALCGFNRTPAAIHDKLRKLGVSR